MLRYSDPIRSSSAIIENFFIAKIEKKTIFSFMISVMSKFVINLDIRRQDDTQPTTPPRSLAINKNNFCAYTTIRSNSELFANELTKSK